MELSSDAPPRLAPWSRRRNVTGAGRTRGRRGNSRRRGGRERDSVKYIAALSVVDFQRATSRRFDSCRMYSSQTDGNGSGGSDTERRRVAGERYSNGINFCRIAPSVSGRNLDAQPSVPLPTKGSKGSKPYWQIATTFYNPLSG